MILPCPPSISERETPTETCFATVDNAHGAAKKTNRKPTKSFIAVDNALLLQGQARRERKEKEKRKKKKEKIVVSGLVLRGP
ncbi:MAG TPA: hypothetical protein ENJ18_03940 [Nannocystis exedens]|nr:hypothetical protein [Nannocystis exedens]